MPIKKKIRILGAGISGMVSAILLARNGFDVEITEKRKRVGSFFERDVHSLRNYYNVLDVVQEYKNLGIEIPKPYPIFKEVRFSPSLKRVEIFSANKPLFYNYIRGYRGKNSFDLKLFEIAKGLGVKFNFGMPAPNDSADIIATGYRAIKGIAYGKHYSNIDIEPHTLYIFLDNDYSPNGYSYIVPYFNEASVVIASTGVKNVHMLKQNFDRLISRNNIVGKVLNNADCENEISGCAFYDLPETAVIENKLYVGEAAGFLDAATGFGTHYAILSGHLAAKTIIENGNYDQLWKQSFGEELEGQFQQRGKLQNFNNVNYEQSIEMLINKFGNKIPAETYRNIKLSK